jgi:hypothetical protein
LRKGLSDHAPLQLWRFPIGLTAVEQAFKGLKLDMAVRPSPRLGKSG